MKTWLVVFFDKDDIVLYSTDVGAPTSAMAIINVSSSIVGRSYLGQVEAIKVWAMRQ